MVFSVQTLDGSRHKTAGRVFKPLPSRPANGLNTETKTWLSAILMSKNLPLIMGFAQKIFVWGTTEKLFSCQNLDLSLS